MAANYPTSRKSNTQILQELEDLSDSLYQSHMSSTTTRRTASLVLPRESVVPPISSGETGPDKEDLNPKPRSRRMSLSPWRSRSKMDTEDIRPKDPIKSQKSLFSDETPTATAATTTPEKKGIWKWKPIRALTHIGMQKLSCLFSVEVVAAQGLPASMNGLRLCVCVRKKDTREGGVQTMPSRVSQGAADFEETLFIRSHVYYSPAGSGAHMKFEPRPFLIYMAAVDAGELDFGRKTVDLSGLIQESIEKSFQGTRIRQWDTNFSLSGKAKGGELVLKLGFQIMEKDGGVGIYSQAEGQKSGKARTHSPSFARKQSKSSFSVPSPRMTSRGLSQLGAGSEDLPMDDLNLDEPAPQATPLLEAATKTDNNDNNNDIEIIDFEVEDKGVEIQDEEEQSESSDKRSVSSEVVKEVVVQDQSHLTRLNELDSIAQQIKALESLMGDEKALKLDEETGSQSLDADEDKVTREFLSMLEGGGGDDNDDDDNESKYEDARMQALQLEDAYEDEEGKEAEVFLPDLGKGLGCVVQTRNGGYLASANPFNVVVGRKETPKLAMQVSKPVVIQSEKGGFEVFQKMAALGLEGLCSRLLSSMALDELCGKTAEQVAFEGIASAIIQGRSKEGASSSAARTIAAVKSMAAMASSGRRERVSSGIWNVSEEGVTVDYLLGFCLQKIEDMAVEALKIQAEVIKDEAPFEVSPLSDGGVFDSAVAVEEWIGGGMESEAITVAVLVQLRDPIRQFEGVGGPMVVLVHAEACTNDTNEDGERKYKVSSLQVGGMKVRSGGARVGWDTEKQRLTALQWLVAYGMGKAGKKGRRGGAKGPDALWSVSSRIMADMWLKAIRNPDVKFNTK
ncbi:protein PLASTID MOVEMENT IMPAIRED 1 [Salvia hispanica]|uniref:protein PLASTID MOVEMENT IMPAIRED 1 n=1 Tax=Salvia hispanica TaxID=49212 RepID=UPI002009A92C|nr:protein PLASTID MOVEMENT IMPAIRED 1 [Salvia hispanica]